MSNEFFEPQTGQRRDSLHSRGTRVSARAIPTTRGSSLPIDSITSADGLPIGVLRGTEAKGKWKVAQETGRIRMKLIKYHPICVLWVLTLLSLGIILQVVK